jgi:aspartate carbamoyltransferase
MTNPFLGRTLAVINDLSVDERHYLFRHTKKLKEAINNNNASVVDGYRINDKNKGITLVFLEDSTRTRESFLNAAEFHRTKVNVFDASHSSFNKKESFADAFNTLVGYDNQIFIIRSKQEGICRWLQEAGSKYAVRNKIKPSPMFINAGDGKHEHPTQELLDEFTFLEHNNWDSSTIHIVLVGDLYHGRTVHSKADGLKIFKNVEIDLIAPAELAMPESYLKKMKANGFKVRVFSSIDEYMKQKNIATKWYFTRPQLERMGEDILRRQDELRSYITFKPEFMKLLPTGTRFYHPLPRHKEHPTIPNWLDDTALNGWEQQSRNGYFIRIILLGAIDGKIGDDFVGKQCVVTEYEDNFIDEIPITEADVQKRNEGIHPIREGIVIDHICKGEESESIWEHLATIRKIMGFSGTGYRGVAKSNKDGLSKGIISIPAHKDINERQIKMLAAVSPGCTLNFISNSEVTKKLNLNMPPRIYGFKQIACANEACISHPDNDENIEGEFFRQGSKTFVCKYCEKPHFFKDIWVE